MNGAGVMSRIAKILHPIEEVLTIKVLPSRSPPCSSSHASISTLSESEPKGVQIDDLGDKSKRFKATIEEFYNENHPLKANVTHAK